MPFRQYPVIQTTPQLGPGKFPGGYLWAVLFRLPVPANADGFIIQEVDISESGTRSGGIAAGIARHYWEAWPVSRGQSEVTAASGLMTVAEFIRSEGGTPPAGGGMTTPFNDFFFRTFAAGNAGTRTMRASAGFYEDRLPADFIAANPATNAGSLPSTVTKPSFWQDNGLFRFLRFQFDFTSSRDPGNATLQTALISVGSIAGNANPDAAILRTH